MTLDNYQENHSYSNNELDDFIFSYKRDVPNFDDEGECNVLCVPVQDGFLKVFHHKPDEVKTKRPIVFLPGFGTATEIWREFHHTHHGYAEYYHIETRDKKSSEIKKYPKADFTIDRIAKDVAAVINFIGLKDKDYILMGTCANGGVVLHGLIEKYFSPPTSIVFDPFTKWTQHRALVKIFMPVMPPFLIGVMKHIIGYFVMAGMKNEAQIERNKATIESAIPWKWRKFSLQNIDFDLTKDLEEIENEVFVFHGPKDKYHPDEVFRKVAETIPKGRFFYMNTIEDLRELLVGVIGTFFAYQTKDEGIPDVLKKYEIDLER
ncbi:MAG: alpha/beta fold hydrolase [Candidatus Heimdallarchaeota archaeon]